MRLIEREDYSIIRSLAKKYNLNVADFGRSIVRQSERSIGRAIRLTENEYNYIMQTSKNNDMSAARFCALACHSFLEEINKHILTEENTDDKKAEKKKATEETADNSKRTKRLEARIYNGADEAELLKYATVHSLKISSLIRYCAVHFDGNNICLKGEW